MWHRRVQSRISLLFQSLRAALWSHQGERPSPVRDRSNRALPRARLSSTRSSALAISPFSPSRPHQLQVRCHRPLSNRQDRVSRAKSRTSLSIRAHRATTLTGQIIPRKAQLRSLRMLVRPVGQSLRVCLRRPGPQSQPTQRQLPLNFRALAVHYSSVCLRLSRAPGNPVEQAAAPHPLASTRNLQLVFQ